MQGQQRRQTNFATLEDQVPADNPVRLIDAFIDKFDAKIRFPKKQCIIAKAARLMRRRYF